MNSPREDLQRMLRVRQYLQEAQDWGKESGVVFDPSGVDASDPETPAAVMSMIDASAERADSVIENLKEKQKLPETG